MISKLFSAALGILTLNSISMNSPKAISLSHFDFQAVEDLIPSWKDSTLNFAYTYFDKTTKNMYEISKDNQTVGYVIKDAVSHEITSFCETDSVPTLHETMEFVANQRQETKDVYAISTANTYDYSRLSYVCNPTQLCCIESSSQAYSRYLKDCPEYYNEYVTNGCTPTAAAMLISFYDRYSSYDLYSGTLPLAHDDNQSGDVANLVNELAVDMQTNAGQSGTNRTKGRTGLKSYLNRHNGGSLDVKNSSSYEDYKNYIMYSNNPAIVHISGHSILGIGYARLRKYNSDGSQYIADYIVSHYDWRSRPGNYYVISSEFEEMTFITK